MICLGHNDPDPIMASTISMAQMDTTSPSELPDDLDQSKMLILTYSQILHMDMLTGEQEDHGEIQENDTATWDFDDKQGDATECGSGGTSLFAKLWHTL